MLERSKLWKYNVLWYTLSEGKSKHRHLKVQQLWSWRLSKNKIEWVSQRRYLNFLCFFKCLCYWRNIFPRIVRLHLCNISFKIVDRHIWQWMWTVVIFQVTMKLRTTGKQISSCLCSIYACINIERKITNMYVRTRIYYKHTQFTHTHRHTNMSLNKYV